MVLLVIIFFIYKMKNLNTGKDLSFALMQLAIKELNELRPNFDALRMVPVVPIHKTLGDLELSDYQNAEKLCHNGFKKPFFDEGNEIVSTDGKKGKDYFLHEGVVVRGTDNQFSFKIKDSEYAFDFSGKE